MKIIHSEDGETWGIVCDRETLLNIFCAVGRSSPENRETFCLEKYHIRIDGRKGSIFYNEISDLLKKLGIERT